MTPIKREEIKNNFLEIFDSAACNVSIACKKVGISRNTYYEWKKEDFEFAEQVRELEESLLDFAETMLYKAIKEGKTSELIFFLKTKGQARGYIEKQQYHMTHDEPDLSGLETAEIIKILEDERQKDSNN